MIFARCWLLGEGESEGILLAGAAGALGIDLERAGVRCVEYSQTDVGMLAKVANQLGIAWYCVVDDDSGRKKYEKKIKEQLNGVSETDRIVFPYKNVERFLCDTGFGSIYEMRMSSQKTKPTSAKGTTAYWDEVIKALPNSYSKPAAVLDAVLEMKASPARVPKALRDVLEKAVALAGG